ncbi:D-alanyl-D-alanine carboxypeptidase family protein [Gryllotalpicola ginsengisoli]|uniref:D-alanyl-D-alanine carboxypeptidase family protein n=1 Tax=Gryllotalpicola ginsengisoli TaxID=444608 RepID=UPI0003B6EA07|nr:serine hydrolase [Gryllotalpicola ginsengisoli]
MTFAADLEPGPPAPATARPRPRYWLRRLIASGFAVIVLALVAYVGVVAVHPLPAVAAVVPDSVTKQIVAEAVDPAWPEHGSAAVGLVGTDGLLGEHGSQKSVPIASMAKTLTALVLLDQHPVKDGGEGPTITFTDADVAILHKVWSEGGSWANVEAGEKLTLKQALTAMLLPSANNYALSLARWSSGSTSAFVKQANAWFTEHGFTHTHMSDPSGFDPGTVSTPADLVGIAKLIVANPVLSAVVRTQHAKLPGAGEVTNTNKLLGHDGVIGIKTGFTTQAGHCLLFAQKVQIAGATRTMVGVVLGQPDYDDLWQGVPKLLKSFAAGFHSLDLTDSGKTVYGSYTTAWGATTELVAAQQPIASVYSDAPVTVTVHTDPIATITGQARAGTVTFRYDGKTVTVPLKTTDPVDGPGLWWKLTHPEEVFSRS